MSNSVHNDHGIYISDRGSFRAVDVAVGEHARLIRTSGLDADQLGLLVTGLADVLAALGLTTGHEPVLTALRDEAQDELADPEPGLGRLHRFVDWVTDCLRRGATPAVTAVVTAGAARLVHEAERTLGS
jgi:hypothetical protein